MVRRRAAARRRRRHAAIVRRAGEGSRREVKSASAHELVFGVYPGGAAGALGQTAPVAPEDPAKRLSSLQLLRPQGRPFVLRLYASYGGAGGSSAAAQAGREIAEYTSAGFQVELALCYRPRPGGAGPGADVPGFVEFARQAVAELGSNPGVVALQVTNEANVNGAPNASDGYYAGAADALIAGVEGSKQEVQRDGFDQLGIGFNWAYQPGDADSAFWSYLGEHGGSAFAGAVDWVGIDAYPGTWGPEMPAAPSLAGRVRRATTAALGALRHTYMPLAGLSRSVPIHVSESGAPTGVLRSESDQATVLQSAVEAVYDHRSAYNVTGYRWFDLRDANSSSASFEDRYGLMSDSYEPKPAFEVYRSLIEAL